MESFEQLCQKRRSIRKYTDRPVEQEKIDYLLRCALMSPSAKRTCPWEFIVVRDEAKLRPLAGCRTYGSQMFDTATAAIIIALDPTLCDNTWMADGAIAAEHILLAAAEQGLGACWCHVYGRPAAPDRVQTGLQPDRVQTENEGRELMAEDFVKELFCIPEKMNVLCAIALGYPDEERRPYDPEKLRYDKVHNEHF